MSQLYAIALNVPSPFFGHIYPHKPYPFYFIPNTPGLAFVMVENGEGLILNVPHTPRNITGFGMTWVVLREEHLSEEEKRKAKPPSHTSGDLTYSLYRTEDKTPIDVFSGEIYPGDFYT